MDFKTSPDVPFVMRGGSDKETALYNRVAVLNRLNWLVQKTIPDFDIRLKTEVWQRCWELEMYKRFYTNDPKHPIDEEFCQNGAKVAVEMESKPVEPVDKKEYMKAFVSATIPTDKTPEAKDGFIANVLRKVRGLK